MKPFLKLLLLMSATAAVVRLQGLSLQAIITVLLAAVCGRKIRPRLKPLLPVLLIIVVGQTLFTDWQTGLAAAVKIINLSLLVLIYTAVTSVKEIGQTFAWLGPNAGLLITLTFSLVPIIIKEWQAVALVQKARGSSSRNPFPVIVPLLHRVFRRAEQLALVISYSKN